MNIDEQLVVEIARRYLGFPPSLLVHTTITSLDRLEIHIPITEELGTPAVWRIDFGRVVVPLAESDRPKPNWEARCALTLEAVSGRLIEAVLDQEKPNTNMVPSPGGDIARRALEARRERYIGLPSAPPTVSLLQTLNNIEVHGYADLTEATRVEVVLVDHEWRDHPRRPVWAVTANGLDPWPISRPVGAPPPDVPIWQRNHLRHVVDATTGEILFATTIPQPSVPT